MDVAALRTFFDQTLSTTVLGFYNTLSGSAFSEATVLALSIQPYINASIIIQLLTIAVPALERMAKEEGEVGKKKLTRITRYTTVGLGLLMGVAYTVMLHNYNILASDANFLSYVVIVLSFTAGSALVMWLGEQITEFGIGNGISIICLPTSFPGSPTTSSAGDQPVHRRDEVVGRTIVLVGVAALVLLIVFINDAERRIPIQYAKRVVGRKVYGGRIPICPLR